MASAAPSRADPARAAPVPRTLRLLERRPPLQQPALPLPWFVRLGHWVDRLLVS